jgi:peptide/nickel transport system permease protein
MSLDGPAVLIPSLAGDQDPPSPGPRRRFPIASFALRRVGIGLLLLVAVSVVVFWGTQVLPGDAATAVLGRSASPEQVEALRQQLGLDQPVVVQYTQWASGLLRGDFGRSAGSETPVATYIAPRALNTAALALATMIVLVPLAIVLGTWAAVRRGRAADHAINAFTLSFIAVPEFVVGTVLIAVFAVRLRWLPPVSIVPLGESAFSNPDILVLPVVTLCLAGMAFLVRMVRAGVLETLESEHVLMARLNGYSARQIMRQSVLRNSLAPSVQVIALTALWLVGGVVIVETVFSYPGLGQGLVDAVEARDIPLVQGIAVLIGAVYILINIVADIAVVLLIPKLRTAL